MARRTAEDVQATVREQTTEVNGCWEWQGFVNPNGYARLQWTSADGVKTIYGHRTSFRAFKGEIPVGMVVRHTCDNRKCLNPDHLELGTQADNMHDRTRRGGCGWAKLTPESVRDIHSEYESGATQTALAMKHGVSQALVSKVLRGKAWQWVTR